MCASLSMLQNGSFSLKLQLSIITIKQQNTYKFLSTISTVYKQSKHSFVFPSRKNLEHRLQSKYLEDQLICLRLCFLINCARDILRSILQCASLQKFLINSPSRLPVVAILQLYYLQYTVSTH